MKNSYCIGEFSQITGLSVKTLRFYHEKGILLPSSVDDATGYRFYNETKIEKAPVIMQLRAMEFSIEDIAAVLTFVRSNKDWHNDAPDVTPDLVKSLREKVKAQAGPFTPDELLKVPLDEK